MENEYEKIGKLYAESLEKSMQKTIEDKWVRLTDEEIFEIFRCTGTSNINPYVLLDDARKIEAKLKEKNT